MAEGLQHQCGGILGLLTFLDDAEKRKALEADLLDKGLRLRWVADGKPRHDFSWRDLLVIVQESPQHSALYRHSSEDWMWDHSSMLLADVADSLRIIAWQKTEGAQRKPPVGQPEPIPRPGVKPAHKHKKGTAVPINEVMARRAAFFDRR